MHVKQELPFMATEHIIMEAVKRGADRQEIHERIRIHSMEASKLIKEQGRENDLLIRLSKDPVIPLDEDDISKLLDPMNFTGRSEKQVEEFIEEFVLPVLSDYLSEETDTEKTEDEIIV
jgi:adenylosuccinate lyase